MTKPPPPKPAYFSTAFKIVVSTLTVVGTLATILTFARQEGMIGPLAVVGADVAHLRITPTSDTAWALGDTMHFAIIATDTNGIALPSPTIEWGVSNIEVARVTPDGSVIATRVGETSVVVTAGKASARAKVVVRPRIVELRRPLDTIPLPEGSSTSLIAVPHDAHGTAVREMMPRWRSLDTTIISVDSLGLATALRPGLVVAEARLDQAITQVVVRVTPVLGSLALGAGGGQHGPAGRQLPAPVVVRTLSKQGQSIEGILVRATVEGGRLGGDTARSDAEGMARFRWILGDRPGGQHLTARADEIDSTLVVRAEADPVAANTRFALVDSLVAAAAGASLGAPVTIRLTDTLGQVLSDVPIRWLGMDGSRIVGTAARSDSLGLAMATWTLGPKVGLNHGRLVAGPGNAPAFAFTARSAAGAPTRIVAVSGDHQRTTVLRNVTVLIRVTDAQGNAVGGATLQSELAAGSVSFVDPQTRPDGTARLRWALGPIAGDQALDVHAGAATLKLTATALPAPAAEVEIVAPGISIISSPSIRVVAMVSDSLGNPIKGVVVQPRVTAGTVSPLRATTGADGRVSFTWTVARRQGDQTIRIHAAGVRADAEKTVRRPNR
jgi:hypothetical protein